LSTEKPCRFCSVNLDAQKSSSTSSMNTRIVDAGGLSDPIHHMHLIISKAAFWHHCSSISTTLPCCYIYIYGCTVAFRSNTVSVDIYYHTDGGMFNIRRLQTPFCAACVSRSLSTLAADAYDQLHAATSSSQPQEQSATTIVASPLQDQLRGTRCRHHSAMTNCLSLHFGVYSQD